MLSWSFLAGKHIFNGQICSWHMHCLDSSQNDFSRQSREDRRELRKNIYPQKTGLFLENGSGSWLVMIVLGWEQIGWLGCSCHLMKAVLAELTCLYQAEEENDGGGRGDQFGVHRVGWFCCAAVRMFSSLVSAQGSPPHWTGLLCALWLSGFLDCGLPVPGRHANPHGQISGRQTTVVEKSDY